MRNELPAKVNAVNRANAYAHELYATLADIFRPLVGQSILKKDGELLARVARLLPDFPCSTPIHVYRYTSDYSLVWVVKTCEMIEGAYSCVYHETSVYIGKLRNGVLIELYPPFEGRTDYRVEDVEAARERYRAARKLADDALSALHPFRE